MTAVSITYWENLRRPAGKRASTTWAKLLDRLSAPKTVAIKYDIPGFALATFVGDKRALANVEQVYAVGLDLDEAVEWSEVRRLFASCASFVHSTWSSTLNEPRARVFLLLSRPVNADEYRKVYASVAGTIANGLVVDKQASDPSRLWFLPAVKTGAPFVSYVGDGSPVDVDAAIAAAPKPTLYIPKQREPGADAGPYQRARKYLMQCPGAVSGNDGHSVTFMIAQRLVRGFALSKEDAFDLMASEWNPRSCPPWSEKELRRKIDQAASAGTMREGSLLERQR